MGLGPPAQGRGIGSVGLRIFIEVRFLFGYNRGLGGVDSIPGYLMSQTSLDVGSKLASRAQEGGRSVRAGAGEFIVDNLWKLFVENDK